MIQTFFQTFFTICIAEMGDKTQFLMIGLTSQYRIHQLVLGTLLAGSVLNGINVALGAVLSDLLPIGYIQLASGLFFLAFAVLSLESGQEQQSHSSGKNQKLPAILLIFLSFFLAELGDKTQLSAIAFSANAPEFRLSVFFGATLGLVAADILGILCGNFLQKHLPDFVFKILSFLIFSLFGFLSVIPVLYELLPAFWASFWLMMITVVYLLALILTWRKKRSTAETSA